MIARVSKIVMMLALSIVLSAGQCSAQYTELAAAEKLLLRGNYAESQAAFEQLLDDVPVQATLGLSRCHWQRGKRDEAIGVLKQQLAKSPNAGQLHARHAWLALQTGDWQTSRELTQQALDLDSENIQAAWVEAELSRVTGQIEQACSAYKEIAERYDQTGNQSESPRELSWYAQALAQHARFNNDKSRFRQLTNQIYPRILSLEPDFWPAHCSTGQLLLEKFNASDAESSLNDALRINPQAADAQVAMARLALGSFQLDRVRRHVSRALAANPNHIDALLCRADMHFASLQPVEAQKTLAQAETLNLLHPKTLGRLSAARQLISKPKQEPLVEDEVPTNRGEYFAAEAAALEHARRYPQAGASLHRAIEAMPQLVGLRGQLGLIEMRLGHESKARKLLEESFTRDPYNVRVKNQLEVLDLLETYAVLETEHFVIRYDGTRDEPLARQMAIFAEQCYDDLTKTFDFQLPEKALLQVFHNGQGVPARQWFGARMVGLPNIHTIAACGGNIVAMVSPTAERRQLNWADILRHEIVHLINIQQTDYAVPHWLTEGCAVWQEGRLRRPSWNKLLIERVPGGDVFNLDTINLGFLKPRSADDWHLAYCQAEQYIDLIVREHGVAGLRKLLAAYRDNLPPEEAISHSLGITQSSLESAYSEELAQTVADLQQRAELQTQPKLAELTGKWEQNPKDAQVGGDLALARLRRGDYPGAGRLASEVLELQPDQPVARLVKAKLLLRIGDEQAATAELQQAADGGMPPPEVLKLLAGIHLRRKEFDQAKQLYQRGAQQLPDDLQWTKALAVVAIRQQDNAELSRLLERIANAEPDNLVTRKKLFQLAQATDDPHQITTWANEVLHIDPNDPSANRAVREVARSQPSQ